MSAMKRNSLTLLRAPNHSMHLTLPLRGIAGDFESWAGE